MSAAHVLLRVQRALAPDPRHLVVSLLLNARTARVTSVAVAPGRPPQLLSAGHSWLAAVTRGSDVVHLSRVPDPFGRRPVGRDRPRPDRLPPCAEGRAVVAVPFGAVHELTSSRVHVLDLGPDHLPTDPQGLRRTLAQRLDSATHAVTVDFTAIAASPQWAAVAPLLGLTPGPRPGP